MIIVIEGDIDEAKLIKIGKFLFKMYAGKKEHINVLIFDKARTKEETTKLLKEMGKR